MASASSASFDDISRVLDGEGAALLAGATEKADALAKHKASIAVYLKIAIFGRQKNAKRPKIIWVNHPSGRGFILKKVAQKKHAPVFDNSLAVAGAVVRFCGALSDQGNACVRGGASRELVGRLFVCVGMFLSGMPLCLL